MDRDLASRQEAREKAKQAQKAQKLLSKFPQEKLDAICQAMSRAFAKEAASLGRLACEETGFGRPEDKEQKNLFASQKVWDAIKDMKTVGLLHKDEKRKIWEIGVPAGVIAGIVPSTNPTSTVCYKAMIALKAGCAIVFSPHPAALECTKKACEVVAKATESAGCPAGAVSCLTMPTMEAVDELMKSPAVSLILATGGPGMVKAAYSSGTPAIGVGAGNGPAYIHRSADVAQAVKDIFRSKTFDNGTICASEQSIVVEKDMDKTVGAEILRQGGFFLSEAQAEAVKKVLFRPDGRMSPKAVGHSAEQIAALAGITVPPGTRVLLARVTDAGPKQLYSHEKLCPVLGYYAEENEASALARCIEILSFEGAGHSFMLHGKDEEVIRRFALEIPVSRFVVNAPGALGGIGAETNLFPALTLGCGAVGGSSSSNNIGPMDLINVRRVAWGTGSSAPKVSVGEISQDTMEALVAEIMKRLV